MTEINGEFIAIESPYRGGGEAEARYLEGLMRRMFKQGHVPLASHRLYPGILDDADMEERALGIEAGFKLYRTLGSTCRRLFAFEEGVSRGMIDGLEDERGRQRYTKAQTPWICDLGHNGEAKPQVIWPSRLPTVTAINIDLNELVVLAWTQERVYFLYPDTGQKFVLEVR